MLECFVFVATIWATIIFLIISPFYADALEVIFFAAEKSFDANIAISGSFLLNAKNFGLER